MTAIWVKVRTSVSAMFIWPVERLNRRWWPVYDNVHIDPTLGPLGQQPHYHVAWNRLSKGNRRKLWDFPITHYAIPQNQVVLIDRKRSTPILSENVSPYARPESLEAMMKEYIKSRSCPEK